MTERSRPHGDEPVYVGEDGVERPKSEILAKFRTEANRKSFFVAALLNPAFHWFFTQAQQALEAELYLPGVSALLNGVEASLRVTLAELAPDSKGNLELSPFESLSNTLLRKARDLDLPISTLAFPGELDFLAALDTKTNARIVQLRHDVCHGNILNFIQTIGDGEIAILTPECLRVVSAQLLDMSYDWTLGLATFREQHGLRPKGMGLPVRPENPLAKWLP